MVERDEQPNSRTTALGNLALAAIPDDANVRVVVLVMDNACNEGGIALAGYDGIDGVQRAAHDLLAHLEAMVNTLGAELRVVVEPRANGGAS